MNNKPVKVEAIESVLRHHSPPEVFLFLTPACKSMLARPRTTASSGRSKGLRRACSMNTGDSTALILAGRRGSSTRFGSRGRGRREGETVKHSSLHPAREDQGWRGAGRRLRCEPPLGAGPHALLRGISVLQHSEMNQCGQSITDKAPQKHKRRPPAPR